MQTQHPTARLHQHRYPVVSAKGLSGKNTQQAARFQGAGLNAADRFVMWFTRNFYDRGDGVRYAVEQTIGYTIPRTSQQLYRTYAITGKENKMAALEMLTRDLAADFTDTFLPGLLATFAIGRFFDRKHQTFVRHNIGSDALHFYQSQMRNQAGTWVSQPEFFHSIESTLKQAAEKATKKPVLNPVHLQTLVNQVQKGKSSVEAAQVLSTRLGLGQFDLHLPVAKSKSTFEVSLKNLLTDLAHITKRELKTTPHQPWGRQMSQLLSKTTRFSHFQMIGNIVALVASVSIPFLIRLMTKKIYGQDAFPGTREIEAHFQDKSKQHKKDPKNDRFVLFPYLKESLQSGKILPTLLTGGFFAVLAGSMLNSFRSKGANLLKLKDWFRVYEFQRHFPFTTVTQMELTFGLLCGIRLAASRDQSEFRETLVRDCIMGWPTLTYFYPKFRGFLSRKYNKHLIKQFGNPMLLMKPNGEVRTAEEISHSLFANLGVRKNADKVIQAVRRSQAWITLTSAVVSCVMLAFAEPQIGIWLTNYFETKRHQNKQQDPHAQPQAEQNQKSEATGAPSHEATRNIPNQSLKVQPNLFAASYGYPYTQFAQPSYYTLANSHRQFQ